MLLNRSGEIMKHIKDWKIFVTAGRAIFTIQDTRTGKRFTFKVLRPRPDYQRNINGDMYFVSVLTGSDNMNNYTYLGLFDTDPVRGLTFRETHRSRIGYPKTREAFIWFARLAELVTSDEELAAHMKFYHAGCCGRCGRTLTVPSSIKSGYGPDCIVVMSGILYGTKDTYEDNAKELRKLFKMASRLKE